MWAVNRSAIQQLFVMYVCRYAHYLSAVYKNETYTTEYRLHNTEYTYIRHSIRKRIQIEDIIWIQKRSTVSKLYIFIILCCLLELICECWKSVMDVSLFVCVRARFEDDTNIFYNGQCREWNDDDRGKTRKSPAQGVREMVMLVCESNRNNTKNKMK